MVFSLEDIHHSILTNAGTQKLWSFYANSRDTTFKAVVNLYVDNFILC